MTPDAIAAEARRWIGTPYRHQGAVRGAGADCLGLVRGVWQAVHGRPPPPIPPYAPDWQGDGDNSLEVAAHRYLEASAEAPRTGDVVLFRLRRHRPARHCAIMVSPDSFVHAQEHLGVVEAPMSESWARRVAGAFRLI